MLPCEKEFRLNKPARGNREYSGSGVHLHPWRRAAEYTLSEWECLAGYVSSGALDIDNNVADRSLRGIALGRKIGCSSEVNREAIPLRPTSASWPPARGAASNPSPTSLASYANCRCCSNNPAASPPPSRFSRCCRSFRPKPGPRHRPRTACCPPDAYKNSAKSRVSN